VDIPNADRALVSGMYAQVTFDIHRQDRPLLVPATAVLYDAKGTRVVVLADGHVTWRTVRVSGDFGDRLALAEGVNEGDLVAVTPSDRLIDGSTVDVALRAVPAPSATVVSPVKAQEKHP
jgi:multidrug efflux pump subunit AcrA (membrane-fusion protein)